MLRAANTNPPKEEAILILVSYGANPSTSTEDGLSLQSFEFSEGFSTKLLGMYRRRKGNEKTDLVFKRLNNTGSTPAVSYQKKRKDSIRQRTLQRLERYL